ncbi:Protein FANTASTIC FOUR 3 [Linum perenne]
MAACRSFQHIFDKQLPETPSLLETLSSPWSQLKPVKPPHDQASFTELFGELHFKESTTSHTASPSSLLDFAAAPKQLPDLFSANLKLPPHPYHLGGSKLGDGSLQLCTEGLGSESFADSEDISADWKHDEEKRSTRGSAIVVKHSSLCRDFRRSRSSSEGGFPPPISCISKTGKPWVCFKSSRQDGRFVLTEVKIPTQEFLTACRENGRLTLKFIQPDNEIVEEFDNNEGEDEQQSHDGEEENHGEER